VVEDNVGLSVGGRGHARDVHLSSDILRPTRSFSNAMRSFRSHGSTARIVELFTATGTITIVIVLVEDSVGARTTCGNSGSDMLRPTRCFSNASISFRSLLSTARIVKLFTATGILTILFYILVEDSVGAWTTFGNSGRYGSSDMLRPTRSFSNAMRSFRSHVSTAWIVELFTATGTLTIVVILVKDSVGAWTTFEIPGKYGSSDILRSTRSFSNAMRSFRSHVSTARIVELFTATGTFTIVIVLVEDSIGAWTTCGNSVRCGSSDGLRPTRSSSNASRSYSSHESTARIVEPSTATGTITIVIVLVEDPVLAWTTCGNSGRCDFSSSDGGDRVYFDGVCNGNKG
jgi:hypothetical protein